MGKSKAVQAHLPQTYCPAVKLSQSPMTFRFQLRNWTDVMFRAAAIVVHV
jgi:hypothetical protein